MLALVFVTLLGCLLEGTLAAEYKKLQNMTRTLKCPLPPGCPPYTEVYLANFHYLNPFPDKKCTEHDIVTALTFFQQMNIGFLGLNVTGTCDEITKEIFTMPRCGCEDIVKGTDKKKMMMQNAFGPQAFQVGTKWSKTNLKWKVTKYPIKNRLSRTQVDDAMRRALDVWARQTPLTFQQVSASSPSDIDIRFETTRHTTREPFYDFDGPGNVLAHAFFPESGVVHFDDDETFVLNENRGNTVELYIVAAHEFGHTLGLSHSNINSALMAPYYRYKTGELLDRDDIQGVQYLYGAGDKTGVVTRKTTPRPIPTTPKPSMPSYCNMKIEASFHLYGITYVFTREGWETVVYTVTANGIDPNSRKRIGELFKKRETSRWPRAHPYRVDAAAYIPDRNIRKIFLFSGTRAYRYTITSYKGPFYLDKGYPRWMEVEEFPERPHAAVPMPLGNDRYYMLIFGSTMVWDWDFETQRVGAWAYPIQTFGRNMVMNVDSAHLDIRGENVIFIKGDQHVVFNLRFRRVMDDSDITSLKKSFFKGQCV